jgi:hypothetical protein
VGYKLAIVLVWLALPLAGLVLLRADYERYQTELDSQLHFATSYREHLLRYANLYDNRRRELSSIIDPRSRINWETRYSELKQQQQAELDALGNPSLSHYPLTADVLSDAAEMLAQQRRHIQDAARLQDRYVKADVGFDDLDDEIFFLKGWARQAQLFGAWDIYMMYQDRIARLEDTYNRRRSQRSSLSNEINITVGQANSYRAELHRLLGTVPDRLALDQGRTYREDLQQRFTSFDLRAQFRQLIGGVQTAQAAN